jgi:hypothetical protein
LGGGKLPLAGLAQETSGGLPLSFGPGDKAILLEMEQSFLVGAGTDRVFWYHDPVLRCSCTGVVLPDPVRWWDSRWWTSVALRLPWLSRYQHSRITSTITIPVLL